MDPLAYFKEFNCAESVLLALSDSLNIPCECIPRIATGFGGGMKTGSVCGAVSGAVMGFGLVHGRMHSQEREKRDHVYDLVSQFITEFEREHKTIVCRELLGVDITTEEGRKRYSSENLHTKCKTYVLTAFQIAQTLLFPE